MSNVDTLRTAANVGLVALFIGAPGCDSWGNKTGLQNQLSDANARATAAQAELADALAQAATADSAAKVAQTERAAADSIAYAAGKALALEKTRAVKEAAMGTGAYLRGQGAEYRSSGSGSSVCPETLTYTQKDTLPDGSIRIYRRTQIQIRGARYGKPGARTGMPRSKLNGRGQ